jgi:hypothetical protein
MNQPSSDDGEDDMERRFQRGLKEDGGPSEAVRRAILDHASRMAVEHARSRPGRRMPAMLATRRWSPILGTLAAAVFAGLLVVPILRAPVAPKQSPLQLPTTAETSRTHNQAPAPELGEVGRNATAASGAAQRKITAEPTKDARQSAISSNYVSQAKTAAPTTARAAAPPAPSAAPPASPAAAPASPPASASDVASVIAGAPAPASRNSARLATASDERGELLRRAAASGDLAAVNALLGSPFDVDARDRSGRTALMLAILNGHAVVVDALLAHGAYVNALDASGVGPLQMARAGGNQEIIDSLSRAGAH